MLREIHWEVTTNCNLQCKHCLLGLSRPRTNELTLQEAMRTLELFAVAGASCIRFTGGEPFMCKWFLEVLTEARRLNLGVEIITNGLLLEEEYLLSRIHNLEITLGISLEGADEQSNDWVRGLGVFQRVTSILGKCQKLGIKTRMYTTVSKLNIHHLRDVALLAQKYGCAGIHFSEISLCGRAMNFIAELILSLEEQKGLPAVVAQIAHEVFEESFLLSDDMCWVDGSSLYMTSEGNLYPCVEVARLNLEDFIGNVRDLNNAEVLNRSINRLKAPFGKCCYAVEVSKHVSLVRNLPMGCALILEELYVDTLPQLYKVLSVLYSEISQYCAECSYPDCMGYVWLLREEVECLLEASVPLVRVNNGPTFIHSFSTDDSGQFNLSERYPVCSQLCEDSRWCDIYDNRPLVCRMYPLGLETTRDGKVVWALHRDCLFVEKLLEQGFLGDFEIKIQQLLENLSAELNNHILGAYREVDALSAFPEGENRYSIIKEVS